MYQGGATRHRAGFLRRCAGGDAPPGDRRSELDEAPPGNGRTPVWDDEMADGPSPVPAARITQSESGTGLERAELQPQAGNQYPGRASPAGAASALPSLRQIFVPLERSSYHLPEISDFSHSLERGYPVIAAVRLDRW